MANSDDFIDDLTGDVIGQLPAPLVVRITVGLAPGAMALLDPADLSPFLRALLTRNPARVEMSARTFDTVFGPTGELLADWLDAQADPVFALAWRRVKLRAQLAHVDDAITEGT